MKACLRCCLPFCCGLAWFLLFYRPCVINPCNSKDRPRPPDLASRGDQQNVFLVYEHCTSSVWEFAAHTQHGLLQYQKGLQALLRFRWMLRLVVNCLTDFCMLINQVLQIITEYSKSSNVLSFEYHVEMCSDWDVLIAFSVWCWTADVVGARCSAIFAKLS